MKAIISIGNVVLDVTFSDTETARAVYEVLPVETGFNVWGDEFYFDVPVSMELDATATTSVKAGEIGYWPPGGALAIFFGPTPMSTGDDPVPASEVNIVGRIEGDSTLLRKVKDAPLIKIEKI